MHADTLVLNDGRRVQGELLGIYGREIEFEERGGGRRRTVRISRDEVERIEFNRSQRDDYRNEPVGVPRGMRERQIVVDAREQWTDTGIDVRAGQQIYFASQGESRWGRDRRDGAEGERNQIFFIGADSGPFRARDTGRLYLGINDDVLTDNSGNLRVTVSY